MRPILSNYVTSITELKKNPTAIIENSEGSPVAILNHNTPAAYIRACPKNPILKTQLRKISN